MMGRQGQGDHEGRPYKNPFFVGAGLVPALARTPNGLETIYKLEGLS
jgi:hypothetical protein